MQFLVAWPSVRSPRFGALVKSEPTLLLRDGCFLREAMRRQRVTEAEMMAALRKGGLNEVASVAAVVLEADGTIGVIGEGPRVGTEGSAIAFAPREP